MMTLPTLHPINLIKFRSGIYWATSKLDIDWYIAFKYASYNNTDADEEVWICILNLENPGRSYAMTDQTVLKNFELERKITPADYPLILNAIETFYKKYSRSEWQLFGSVNRIGHQYPKNNL